MSLIREMLLEQAGVVHLEDVCEFFGLSPETALKHASAQQLPVPTFKIGSQKSPWMVNAQDVVDYVQKKHREAAKEHEAINAA